ncbi:MAG: hypothetical protein KDA44_14460 [Planctomycetales bacterium]|nr:hypothetical protein [Planctomycetales bacterium]
MRWFEQVPAYIGKFVAFARQVSARQLEQFVSGPSGASYPGHAISHRERLSVAGVVWLPKNEEDQLPASIEADDTKHNRVECRIQRLSAIANGLPLRTIDQFGIRDRLASDLSIHLEDFRECLSSGSLQRRQAATPWACSNIIDEP